MMQCTVQQHIRHSTLYGDIRRQKDALLAEVLAVVEFRRWKGLEFSASKKEYQFDEVPALAQAGWTQEKYQQEKLADERSFEE